MTAIGRAPWPLDALAEIAKVLESLGHAATQQNANSSRFGKFLRLHVTRSGIGVEISTYLLEVSRVVSGAERFRIFRELLGGAPEQLQSWGLTHLAAESSGLPELAAAMAQLGLRRLLQDMLEATVGWPWRRVPGGCQHYPCTGPPVA